jgi:regulator of sigma E protease
MLNVISAAIALGILVLVHEFGHFLVARLANVKVLVFSLGFGKKLITFKRGETEYAISIFPLGGYVKMLGESGEDEISEDEAHRSYSNKPPLVKMAIAFAGPFFNVLFAGFLFYLIFVTGFPVLLPKVGDIIKDSPAAQAGLQAGDVIEGIEGKAVREWTDLQNTVTGSELKPLRFAVKRDGKIFDVNITPKESEDKNIFGEKVNRKMIGVAPSGETVIQKENPIAAFPKAVLRTYNICELTVVGLAKLVRGSISAKNIGGPILILQTAGKTAREGKSTFLSFVAIISINLAIVNVLPIPILDGGHILFYAIEIITRRSISQKTVEMAQKVGIVILVMIMAFAFYNDIVRMLGPGKLFGIF